MEAPQNRRFYVKDGVPPPLAHLYREHIGNPLGTCWERRKNEKNPLPHPAAPKLKSKKSRHFECMLSLPIGCMEFLFPKLFVTILGLG
jgi:hypothetical protein